MKRVLSLALATLLLGSTAASAQGWGHGHSHGNYGWSHHGYHGGHGDAAAAVGLGIFALGALAIISSQNAHHYDAPAYDDRYGPPPDYRNAPNDRYDDRDAPPDDGRYDGGED